MRIGMIIGADGVNRTVGDLVKTGATNGRAEVRQHLDGADDVVRRDRRAVGHRACDEAHRARYRGRADVSATSDGACVAGADGGVGEQQPLFARHRPVAPDRHRKHVGLFVRETGARTCANTSKCSVRCCAAKPCSTTATNITCTASRSPCPARSRVPLLVAALGPVMLKLTGELADGTITWMVGPKTMEEHIVPSLTAAARGAGKPAPIVVGGFPVVLTNKPDEARAQHRTTADDLRSIAVVSRDARSRRRQRSGGHRARRRRKLPARRDRSAAQHRRDGFQRGNRGGGRGNCRSHAAIPREPEGLKRREYVHLNVWDDAAEHATYRVIFRNPFAARQRGCKGAFLGGSKRDVGGIVGSGTAATVAATRSE